MRLEPLQEAEWAALGGAQSRGLAVSRGFPCTPTCTPELGNEPPEGKLLLPSARLCAGTPVHPCQWRGPSATPGGFLLRLSWDEVRGSAGLGSLLGVLGQTPSAHSGAGRIQFCEVAGLMSRVPAGWPAAGVVPRFWRLSLLGFWLPSSAIRAHGPSCFHALLSPLCLVSHSSAPLLPLRAHVTTLG